MSRHTPSRASRPTSEVRSPGPADALILALADPLGTASERVDDLLGVDARLTFSAFVPACSPPAEAGTDPQWLALLRAVPVRETGWSLKLMCSICPTPAPDENRAGVLAALKRDKGLRSGADLPNPIHILACHRWYLHHGGRDVAWRAQVLSAEPLDMHRTQISLEPEQYRRLGEEARLRRISLAALIRSLIDEHLGRSQPPEEDPLDRLVGIGEGTGEPVGREHDRYLYGSGAP